MPCFLVYTPAVSFLSDNFEILANVIVSDDIGEAVIKGHYYFEITLEVFVPVLNNGPKLKECLFKMTLINN